MFSIKNLALPIDQAKKESLFNQALFAVKIGLTLFDPYSHFDN